MKILNNGQYNHAEAFCLMSYQCEICGHNERIWNSRDGVTPFIIGCPVCGQPTHKHVDWGNDVCSPLHSMMLKPGDRYFTDLTMARAREIAAIRVDRMIAEGGMPANTRNRVIAIAAESYFGDGTNPDIIAKT